MEALTASALLVASVILASYDSSQNVTDRHLIKVINEKLAKECISFSPFDMTPGGYPEKPVNVQLGNSEELNAKRLSLPNAFVNAGILSVRDARMKNDWTGQIVQTKEFALTAEGRQYLKTPRSSSFCAGHYRVDKIVDFTKLNESMGMTVISVNYTYSPIDLPEWAKSVEIKGAIAALQDKQQGSITLTLKNTDWSTKK